MPLIVNCQTSSKIWQAEDSTYCMTSLEYDGLRAFYYQYQELSAKYDSLQFKIVLKDKAINTCMDSRDSLIVDNKEMINQIDHMSTKLRGISDDLNKVDTKYRTWKTIGISSSVALIITGIIIIAI